MLNTYSPAHDFFPLAALAAGAAQASAAPVRVRYPSPPAALRWLRVQLAVLQVVAPAWAFRLAWRLFTTPRPQPVKAWEAAALAGSRAGQVPYDDSAVAIYEWGPAAAPAVVLVHGWEHRASFWGAWVAPLRAAGYRVLALDGPAHGRTAGRQTTPPEFGRAVQAVVNYAGLSGPVRGVVAHSFGAVSVVGLPLAPPPGQATLPRLVLLSAPLSPRAVAGRFAELLGLRPALLARMRAHMRQSIGGRDIDEFGTSVAGPKLPVDKTLLLHDEHDAVVPFAEGQQIAAAWPAAQFCATRGLGHNRILRDAALVARAVAFLG